MNNSMNAKTDLKKVKEIAISFPHQTPMEICLTYLKMQLSTISGLLILKRL